MPVLHIVYLEAPVNSSTNHQDVYFPGLFRSRGNPM